MKQFIRKIQVKSLISACAFATFFAAVSAYAGVSGTKHDLSVSGPGPIKATGITEKCVFCHTPHNTSNTYPLWNHSLSSATYTVPGKGSGYITPGQPDKGSKLCLGCHDGTIAVGTVANTPGRGTTGSIAVTGGSSGKIAPGMTGYVSTNLSGQHKVSIEYDSTVASMHGWPWPIPSNDPVRLRPTSHDNGYGTSTGMGIQCRTCHDPHDDTIACFLVKGVNASHTCPFPKPPNPTHNTDALCLTCHT